MLNLKTSEMKQCVGPCSRSLPRWRFYFRESSPDGLQSWCIGCTNESVRKNRNLEREREVKYNMYPGQYAIVLKEQNKECAIPSCYCRELVIDHNHKTGKFRALLCRIHNAGLGHFDDDPQLLREAADYLEKHA